MWIDYNAAITESVEELANLEKRYRGSLFEDRIRMLRLLKSGFSRSQRGLTDVLGYNERHLRVWWKEYREQGLNGLLVKSKRGGSKERITEEALAGLKQEFHRRDGMISLEEARCYLIERWGIHYKGITSISMLFKRHKIKKKTGRKRHPKSDLQAQSDFKK